MNLTQKNNHKYKVTIGITTYDRHELLIETLNSVINQTYLNLEILVGNDNPSRFLTLENLGFSEDSRVRIINRDKNLGEINNLNLLLNESSGDFFTWLADDDLIHQQHIEILMKPFSPNCETMAVYSGYTSDILELNISSKINETEVKFQELDFCKFLLLFSQRQIDIIGCYGIFERATLIQTGGFIRLGNGLSPYSDTLIPVMISKLSSISFTNIPTVFFRSHPNSMSNSLTDIETYLTAEYDFIKRVSELIDSEPLSYRKVIFKSFHDWFRQNHLTLISRSSLNYFEDFLLWFKSCRKNKANFDQTNFRFSSRLLSGVIILVKHRISSTIARL